MANTLVLCVLQSYLQMRGSNPPANISMTYLRRLFVITNKAEHEHNSRKKNSETLWGLVAGNTPSAQAVAGGMLGSGNQMGAPPP